MIHDYYIIAVIGNRQGWTYEDVEKHLDEYLQRYENDNFLVISGGAIGVDSYVELYCDKHDIAFQKILPIKNIGNFNKFFLRNDFLAVLCDEMVAFNKKEKSGTSYTIRQAKGFGREVIVISSS